MASQQGTVDFLVDQMAAAGTLAARKMFGEYAIYCDGKMFALVCNDQLFIKPVAASRAWIGEPQQAQPYPQAKPWFLIPGDRWDEREWLAELARRTAAELPLPAPRKKTVKRAAKNPA
ncbi:TfoX/Sxy family protein [Pseudoduganella sp. UC29_71]|jgi:TfoX/Sxy family transcriptional regulator of competence genes|uniref:TfoX/Sxy family protein n=1 Tax=Pseudoduganella sp. UC29_71 TaxID=3350174 RepID=UPI0036704D5B